MQQYTKKLVDYLDIVKRRKYYIFVSWLLISALSVIVAFKMPKIYRSMATLLIEAPIPTKLIEAPESQFAEERIQSIYQKVMTTDKVLAIIDSNDLYSHSKGGLSKYELAELFRQNVEVKLAVTSIIPKANSGTAEIAFDLSFTDSEANKAQQIASKLAALFIEQNDKTRTQRVIKATDFLMDESDKLNQELQKIDSKIAAFKEQNSFSLPEQMSGNLIAIDRAESELRDTDSQIRATKERIAFLTVELARAHEDITIGTDSKAPRSLRSLRAQYRQFSSQYFPTHPLMVRLKSEIKSLDPAFEEQLLQEDILKQLEKARLELKLIEETHVENSSDIAKHRKKINELEKQLKNTQESSRQDQERSDLRTYNPAYLTVEAQYKSSQAELESLRQKQDYLKVKLEQIQDHLLKAPQIEMAYTDLIRERDNAIKKYSQLKEKWLDAKLVQTLEEQQQGQTLVLIEQAAIPSHPEKAIRRKVAIGGFFVGLIGGVSLAFFVEYIQPGLRGYRAISELTGLMPLVVVPYIESPSELDERLVKQNKLRKMMVRAGVAIIVLAVVFIWNFFLPLAPT